MHPFVLNYKMSKQITIEHNTTQLDTIFMNTLKLVFYGYLFTPYFLVAVLLLRS